MTQKLIKLKKKVTKSDHSKYITIEEFNKLISDNIAAKLALTKLATEIDVADFLKDFN